MPKPLNSGYQVESWPLERLVPYIRNPRKNDEAVDRMAASIQEFGFKVPVLARSNGEVVDGHLRIKAARKLEIPEVPVILCDEWSEAQVKAFRLLVNRSVNWAEWDQELVGLEMVDLKALEYDLALTGFDSPEVKQFLKAAEVLPPGSDEEAVPEPPAQPTTVLGDLWLLGEHRVLCGDSTSIDATQRLCGATFADMVFTDPPYNVALGMNETPEEAKRRNRRTDGLVVSNDSMEDGDFFEFLRTCLSNASVVTKEGGAAYVCHADSEGINFRCALKESGWLLKQCLIWVKQQFVMGRQDYHWQHEPILYGWKPGSAHSWCGDRSQSTVWSVDRPMRNPEHPTMKPVELIEKGISNSSKPGDVVLDIFGGSGSTLIACEKTGRLARLMELAPQYCDVIVSRWQTFTGKQATLEGDGRTFEELKNSRLHVEAA